MASWTYKGRSPTVSLTRAIVLIDTDRRERSGFVAWGCRSMRLCASSLRPRASRVKLSTCSGTSEPSRPGSQSRRQSLTPWLGPATGAVEAVPRHTEIPDLLARKIVGAGVPESL